MAAAIRHPAVGRWAPTMLLVAEVLTIPVLREAIDAGAGAVFCWPDERLELTEAIATASVPEPSEPGARGTVVAVLGARGACGATFVSCQLAAAFVDLGATSALVDLDVGFGELAVALAGPADPPPATIADLVAVREELTPGHVEDALVRHPRGFSILLAPPDPALLDGTAVGLYRGAVALLAGSFQAVVLHLPRVIDEVTHAAVAMADEVVVLVAPDTFGLYAARRLIGALGLREGRPCRLVLNPQVRGEIGLDEVERVVGIRPAAAIRLDPAVRRVQERGDLLGPRARRAGADIRSLAHSLLGRPSQGRARVVSIGRTGRTASS